jgi:large subunit ribosomal protein LP2
MKHVAAYMLATLGGVEQPSVADIKNILSAAGIQTEDERAEQLISSLSGKNVEEVVSSGMNKLASMPSGGAAVSAAPATGASAAAAKEEAKAEVKEESDDDMGFGLFD